MTPRSHPTVPLFTLFTLVVMTCCVAPAWPAAATRSVIVEGRVAAADGWPMPGAMVRVSGDRRASARADEYGRYSLSIPIGALEALAQRPVSLELGATARGTRLVTSFGAARVAFELGLARTDSGPVLRIRSSEQEVALTLARAIELDDGRGAAFTVNFIAAPGTAPAEPSPPLSAEQRVTPRGIPLGAVRFEPAPAAPRAARRTETPKPRARAVPAPPSERAASKRTSAAARDSVKAARRAEQALARTRQREASQAAAAGRAAEKRATATRDSTRLDRAEQARREAVARLRRQQLARDSVLALAKRPAIRRIEGVAAPAPAAAEATQPTGNVRVWQGAAVEAPAAFPAADCECIVQGTVEVLSDRPLARRARIVVGLENRSAPRDTVELFMGSPRPFRLEGVPCGGARLALHALDRRSLSWVSRDALRPLECVAGGRLQPRIQVRVR